jgi:hypothetical protein
MVFSRLVALKNRLVMNTSVALTMALSKVITLLPLFAAVGLATNKGLDRFFEICHNAFINFERTI